MSLLEATCALGLAAVVVGASLSLWQLDSSTIAHAREVRMVDDAADAYAAAAVAQGAAVAPPTTGTVSYAVYQATYDVQVTVRQGAATQTLELLDNDPALTLPQPVHDHAAV